MKMFFLVCLTFLSEVRNEFLVLIKRRTFLRWKIRQSTAQAFFLALGSTVYCYVNDMETKENEGIDDGILFDIEAKRSNSLKEEEIIEENEN